MHAQVFVRIIKDFARSKSAAMRASFVLVARHLAEHFSANFFKQHLLSLCLECCYDKVANVRMAMPQLLPSMKHCITLPEDVEFLEKLNSAMSNLLTDSDRDVSAIARSMHADFKRVPVRVMGAGMLDLHGHGKARYAPPAVAGNPADCRMLIHLPAEDTAC